jgi:phospho-N-acetylmuramoyl-pentapeptide-transferase
VGGVGILSAKPVTVFLAGGFFVAETASVMLQVIWFRFTKGKRLFLMAPLHHHLEKCGLCEGHIVAIGAAASALFCALAFLGG